MFSRNGMRAYMYTRPLDLTVLNYTIVLSKQSKISENCVTKSATKINQFWTGVDNHTAVY